MSLSNTQRRRLSRPMSLLGVVFACVLVGVIGGAVYGGYQAGLAQREQQWQATQTIELQLQYNLGAADLAGGRYEIAAERFAYILTRDPDYPGAAEGLAQARAALNVTATSTPPPLPTPASADPAAYFALAEEYLALENWDGVITQLAILRGLDPDYEAVRADGMLFVALRNRGVARILGKIMEAGIFDLDQAGAFGPLDNEALNYRAWARLYLNAQSYWGVNWEQTVQILELLHALAPNFHDTSARYFQALVNYGHGLAAAGDACRAAEQYALAANLQADAALAEALLTAQAACALLTPTPDPLVTPEMTPTPEG